MTGTHGSGLEWTTLVKKRRSATAGLPPGTEALQWVANTVTLICGTRDAVLVDTFLSAEQTRELVDWIAASGKNLTAIYVTHAHGDHFSGSACSKRFPRRTRRGNGGGRRGNAASDLAGIHGRVLESSFPAAIHSRRRRASVSAR